MRSSDKTLACRVTVCNRGNTVVIEVDGELDLITGYDLRHAFSAALHRTTGDVALDLSRVTAVDDQGIAALTWCSDQAIQARHVLTWSVCSRPFIRDLQARLGHREARQRPTPTGASTAPDTA